MAFAIGMAVGLTCSQLIGAYLRYLPFEAQLAAEDRRRLWRYILLWAPVAVTIYMAVFSEIGTDVETYKRIHYLGPWPFFAASVYVIRNEWPRHIFVVGMQTLWFLVLHTISGSLILAFLPPALGAGPTRIPIQTASYIILFLILLPIERSLFRSILPSPHVFEERLSGWCFALLPLGLCATPIIALLDRPLMYTWTDRISRFFLFIWGFAIYRYTAYVGKRAEEMQRQEHTSQILAQQLQSLQDRATLMEERAQDVRRVRHDLRHYNRLLASLLDAGETEKAREVIEMQDQDLLTAPLLTYCNSPILNAALTVYLQQAKQSDIPVTHKINLDDPARPSGGDNDLAILLSNVLENAIIASRKQPMGHRALRLSLQYIAPQYILAVENRYDAPVVFGADGLPTTKAKGHGTGMVSLSSFRKKYGADVVFEQENGVVRLMMYWMSVEA